MDVVRPRLCVKTPHGTLRQPLSWGASRKGEWGMAHRTVSRGLCSSSHDTLRVCVRWSTED